MRPRGASSEVTKRQCFANLANETVRQTNPSSINGAWADGTDLQTPRDRKCSWANLLKLIAYPAKFLFSPVPIFDFLRSPLVKKW